MNDGTRTEPVAMLALAQDTATLSIERFTLLADDVDPEKALFVLGIRSPESAEGTATAYLTRSERRRLADLLLADDDGAAA